MASATTNGKKSGERSGAEGEKPNGTRNRGARCIALIGPYLSGKTTLLEAILARTGSVQRTGSVSAGTSTGDASPEARAHVMSVEMNIADATFMGETFTFIDLPGSIEFVAESNAVLPAIDLAVVVCEPDPRRIPALQIVLKTLAQASVPHVLFLNKIDSFSTPVREIIPMLQPASTKPLILRQIPIWKDGKATGFVDLALERAFVYRDQAPSEVIPIPETVKGRESEARFHMLEQIADYDDALMEQLLNDQQPRADHVFGDLTREVQTALICPVFLGSAQNGNGIVRLLKALRHEAPFVETTRARLGLADTPPAAQVVKTIYSPQGGKLSVVRVLSGSFAEGAVVAGPQAEARAAGVVSFLGEAQRKRGAAEAGDTVGLSRLDGISTGQTITTTKKTVKQVPTLPIREPVYSLAIALSNRNDDVKLSAAMAKLIEEDPALRLDHDAGTQQIILWGQGEMHLRVALERLKRKYGIVAQTKPRQIAYRETVRKGTEVRGRHKKQSGGHGQFGDVLLDIKPLPRGTGIQFGEKIHGGTVPKQFVPSVEIGVRDYLNTGPLGFPVVDVAVTLLDGSYHSVDSSDMAFRQAGRIAMADGMPNCQPVLLEPIMAVSVAAPSEATARVNAIIAQRRGQILGFDSREGWPGWDVVEAQMPESEMADLIVELRSATAGSGTYAAKFDHLAELTGKLADAAVSSRSKN